MRARLRLPLKYAGRRYGYFYTQAVSSFPTLQITEGELFALLVAEKALPQEHGTNVEKPPPTAFRKMAAALHDTISLNLVDWEQTISFRTRAEPIVKLEMFDTLAKAAAQRRQLQLTYRKPGKPQTELRVVDPDHLANGNGEWFLFAFDHLRRDIRTFVPARVQTAQFTGKSFVRPRKFSVQQTLRDSFGVHSGRSVFEVLIRFNASAADYIREKRWHPSQELRELKDGGVELRLRLSSLGEIERWILGWRGTAAPPTPTELVAVGEPAAPAP